MAVQDWKKSNSEILKNYLLNFIKENKINEYFSFSTKLDNNIKTNIYNSDILIFIFPLYVDSIPSNLLSLLVNFENEKLINSKTKIYCIVNNGFFEGVQNHLAISQIRCWSKKVNAQWGQGIGVGGGELLSHLKKVPLGNGPLKNLGITLEKFSKNILLLKSNEDIYINPNYPRILYFLQANISWFIIARKNKLKFRDLFKKIYNKQNWQILFVKIGGFYMEKICIIYDSKHNMNTEKLVLSLKETYDSIDIIKVNNFDINTLNNYQKIGLASGIYWRKFSKNIEELLNKILDSDVKNLFFIYTSGVGRVRYEKKID